jgi:hypothetical protein
MTIDFVVVELELVIGSDTTGYAFTYVVAKVWFGCTVASYTHYPTISTDMLQRVQERRPTYNNSAQITNSASASTLKLIYYRVCHRSLKEMRVCSTVDCLGR